MDGGNGDDLLIGGRGNDNLTGGNGNDIILGGRGNDNIVGGNGDDLLVGGQGFDRVEGGRGQDTIGKDQYDTIVRSSVFHRLIDGQDKIIETKESDLRRYPSHIL